MVELSTADAEKWRPLLAGGWKPALSAERALEGDVRELHQIQRRLGRDEVEQLVRRYQAGVSTTELAHELGLRRDRISLILRRAGVTIRPGHQSKLTLAMKQRAAELYLSGLSLKKVGTILGTSDGTVLKALIQLGVPRR